MATKKSATKSKPLGRGTKVFLRTVTSYYTGEVIEASDNEIVLVRAAWIADTGRFAQAMATGEFSEVEPYPDTHEVSINRGSITDIVRNWPHRLPRTQK
jgi:hypothetical protein